MAVDGQALLDISTAGSYVEVDGTKITRFADDANPWQVDTLQVTGHGVSINGDILAWAQPVAIMITLNVLSCDPAVPKLMNLLYEAKLQPGSGDAATFTPPTPFNIKIYAGGNIKNTAVFDQCRIVAGPPMYSASTAGRFTALSFQFLAAKYSPPTK